MKNQITNNHQINFTSAKSVYADIKHRVDIRGDKSDQFLKEIFIEFLKDSKLTEKDKENIIRAVYPGPELLLEIASDYEESIDLLMKM